MVILEGMLFGLAIVASDVGGPKEILVNGYTGLFCIPRDSASIERRVFQLIDDPGLRVRLGRNASQQVRSRWLYRNVIDQMRFIYGEIAGTRGPAGTR